MSDFEKIILEGSSQKSDNWHEIRRGRFTSSEIHKLFTKSKTKEFANAHEGFGQTAVTYIETKAMEIFTGENLSSDIDNLYAVKWGNTFEECARIFYELTTGDKAEVCGFYPHGENAGGSVDFKSRMVGVGEIKCPSNRSVHASYLMNIPSFDFLRQVKDEYWTQLQCNMHFTGLPSCAFISFDPRYFTQAWPDQDEQSFSPQYAFETATERQKKLGFLMVQGEYDEAFGIQLEETLARAVKMRDRLLNQISERIKL